MRGPGNGRSPPPAAISKGRITPHIVVHGSFPFESNPIPLLRNLPLLLLGEAFSLQDGIVLVFLGGVNVTFEVGYDAWKAQAQRAVGVGVGVVVIIVVVVVVAAVVVSAVIPGAVIHGADVGAS